MLNFQDKEPCTVIAYKMVKIEGEKTYQEIDVLIDEEDADWVCQYRWRVDINGYIVRGMRNKKGKYYLLRLHRQIMKRHGLLKYHDYWENLEVDHINHNKYDNRKINLRVCTPDENKRNRSSKNGENRGIQQTPRGYRVTIYVEGKAIYIGTFPNLKLAKHYYNLAGSQLHGEFFNPTTGERKDEH